MKRALRNIGIIGAMWLVMASNLPPLQAKQVLRSKQAIQRIVKPPRPEREWPKFMPKHTRAIRDSYLVRLTASAVGEFAGDGRVLDLAKQLQRGNPGLRRIRRLFSPALRGFVADMSEVAALELSKDPMVEFVEQDNYISTGATQAYNWNSGSTAPWALDRIDRHNGTNSEYTYANTGAGVTIYVVDSSVRLDHQEFESRADSVDLSDSEINGDPEEADPGCNAGHGTMVASVAAGATVGVAKDANVFGVNVYNEGCFGSLGVFVSAAEWIQEHHADPSVVNFSTYDPADTLGAFFTSAVENLLGEGVPIVALAGNENEDACNFTPQVVSDVIVVGATDQSDYRLDVATHLGSNYGSCVDLFAPGVDVDKATPNSTSSYNNTLDGTSFAAPLVAGMAARYLEINPSASPTDVESYIVGHATYGVVSNAGSGSPNLMLYTWALEEETEVSAGTNEHVISLQVSNNDYVSAEYNGGDQVNANRGSAQQWENFALVDLNGGSLRDGDTVALRTASTLYLQAVNGGDDTMRAVGRAVGSWETFTLKTLDCSSCTVGSGDHIALQADDGHWVTASGGGGSALNADGSSPSSYETLKIIIY